MASNRIVLPNSVPVGYRFQPTDEEIVSHFLKNKMLGNDHLVQPIPEVDICKYEPWELPDLSVVDSDDPEWFFFAIRDFKYCHGPRSNRATRGGYWKATGKDRKIRARSTKILIGTKKTLVFYKGRVPKGVKTNWVIHEYHSVDNNPQRTVYVVCRLKKKDDEKVDKSANDECENGNVDFGLQSETIESSMPEVSLEENGGLDFAPSFFEPTCEWKDELDLDDFVNSLIVDGEVNCLTLDREKYYYEETANPFDDLFIQSQWTGSTPLEGAMLNRDTNLEAIRSLFGDLPPNSSSISECSNWRIEPQCSNLRVEPQMRMMRKSRGNMFESKHLQYEEQTNIHRCNEILGPDISRESTDDIRRTNRIFKTNAPLKGGPRIRLQRRIGNAAVNPIKAEKESKYTSNDRREEIKIHTRPPSEYFANVIVGIILFVVFVREMVLHGDWGI